MLCDDALHVKLGKQTLELFLERGAISREQYEKSLGELERTGKGDEKREKTGEPLDKQG